MRVDLRLSLTKRKWNNLLFSSVFTHFNNENNIIADLYLRFSCGYGCKFFFSQMLLTHNKVRYEVQYKLFLWTVDSVDA